MVFFKNQSDILKLIYRKIFCPKNIKKYKYIYKNKKNPGKSIKFNLKTNYLKVENLFKSIKMRTMKKLKKTIILSVF